MVAISPRVVGTGTRARRLVSRAVRDRAGQQRRAPGRESVPNRPHHYLIVTATMPGASQITVASPEKPLFSVLIRLDRAQLFVRSEDIHDAMAYPLSIDEPGIWFFDDSEASGA